MATVLVTGGTGLLGRRLVPALVDRGHTVRVLSRRERPDIGASVACVRGDLRTGTGLATALEGIEVVVHGATNPARPRATDVDGTGRLLESALAATRPHVIFPSIVGVDRHRFRYYRAKRQAEELVAGSGLPFTVLRATQFHELLDKGLGLLTRSPVVPVPAGFVFQPIDAGEVVDRLVELVDAGPLGRVADVGGPEVRKLKDLARAWLDMRHRRRVVVPVWLPGRVAGDFRRGVHTCPERAIGTITWEDHLAGRRAV